MGGRCWSPPGVRTRGTGMRWAARHGWGPTGDIGPRVQRERGQSRAAPWGKAKPGAGRGRTGGLPGGQGWHGRSPGHYLPEVSGAFGCCPLSFPSAQPLSGFLSLPLAGLSALLQTFLKSFFFWQKNILFLVSVQRDVLFSPSLIELICPAVFDSSN